jgi:death-on-curing family protein
MRRGSTLSELANEAGLDPDEALIALWDAGIESFSGPTDLLAASDLLRARRALGLPKARDLSRVAYWKGKLALDDEQFEQLLGDLGIRLSPRSRNLPKGAVSKLKRALQARPPAIPEQRKDSPPEPLSEAPLLSWKTIGKQRPFRCLTAAELLSIHDELVQDFATGPDPLEPPGARDMGLVESSAMRPSTAVGGINKYCSVEMAAAATMHSIVHNHPFHNGNKRTALVAMLVFLDAHDLMLTCGEDELFMLVLRVAQHSLIPKHWDQLADREVMAMASWIHERSRQVDRSERLVKWFKLRQILASHGCELSHPRVGNRIDITRHMQERKWFKTRQRRLHVQVAYGGEGREVERETLRHIRRQLHLDEENGVDSKIFYAGEAQTADFIAKYQKTLKRLAKL